MKPGIKIGLPNWRQRLERSHASYVEVYFMLPRFKEHQEMFTYLKRKRINFGLHFWDKLPGDFMPNLVFKGKIADNSVRLIKQTLKIAKKIGACYVNIHPGSFRLRKIFFKNTGVRVKVTSKKISFFEGKKEFFKNATLLNNYAKKRGVLLLIETVCRRDVAGWIDSSFLKQTRSKQATCPSFNIDSQILYQLAQKENIFLTNDFGHTLTETISNNHSLVFENLFLTTKKLASFTKLIHITTTPPPFNGTDAHGGLLESDFSKNPVPNKKEIIKLFKIFRNRDDVWVVPEPFKNHVGNFKALFSILSETSSA